MIISKPLSESLRCASLLSRPLEFFGYSKFLTHAKDIGSREPMFVDSKGIENKGVTYRSIFQLPWKLNS